jgi:hypothetical protein
MRGKDLIFLFIIIILNKQVNQEDKKSDLISRETREDLIFFMKMMI